MKRMLILLISLSVFFAIMPMSIAAIGVSPASYTIDFKPGLKENLFFDFTEDKNLDLEIYVEGDLAQYVKLSKTKLSGPGSVGITLKLPDKINIPGTHRIYVGARQITSDGGGFGIVGNIKGIIKIIVPYPGQYATIGVSATNANAGDQVNITSLINNFGVESVEAEGKVSIYKSDEYVTDIALGNFDLASPDQREVIKYINTVNYAAGNYLAIAQLFYGDGLKAESNASFRLGELFVRILNYTHALEKDKLNRFEVNVQSEWNDPIDGVYANVTVKGYPISFLTPSTHLDSFGEGTLTGFFDTTGIQEKTFDALIKVHYGEKATETIATIGFKKHVDYLIIGLIVAIIAILALVAYVTYALKKTEKKKRK